MCLIQNFSFNASDEFSFAFCFYCFWRIFAPKLHVKITAPASRDLQENDIDVYVRLDSLATTVRKVTLKMIEMNFAFNFNAVVYFFRGFKI